MELTLRRTDFTSVSTIGELFVNGVRECYTLEDIVRIGPKVHGSTAIPFGRYEVAVTHSARFKRLLPLLLNVPEFDGIRIHPGNTSADTEGCILVGQTKSKDAIHESRAAFNNLFPRILEATRNEKVFVSIPDLRPGADPTLLPDVAATRTAVVASVNGLNLRDSPHRSGNWIITVPQGRRLEFVEVVQGEAVSGNANWYRTERNEYFWSGGVR